MPSESYSFEVLGVQMRRKLFFVKQQYNPHTFQFFLFTLPISPLTFTKYFNSSQLTAFKVLGALSHFLLDVGSSKKKCWTTFINKWVRVFFFFLSVKLLAYACMTIMTIICTLHT